MNKNIKENLFIFLLAPVNVISFVLLYHTFCMQYGSHYESQLEVLEICINTCTHAFEMC
jgi:hypothetical protein